MSRAHVYPGSCHCRNVELRLESDRAPRELGLRADGCTFCSKHYALFTSDPSGELSIVVHDPSLLERYRFGTKTADFLLCRACGVFVAAMMPDPAVAVINVNALEARAAFLENEPVLASLEGETLEQRLARRKARWTPVASFLVTGTRPAPQ